MLTCTCSGTVLLEYTVQVSWDDLFILLCIVVSDVNVEVLARGTVGFSGMDTQLVLLKLVCLVVYTLLAHSLALCRNTRES